MSDDTDTPPCWQLQGWDAFAHDPYPIGSYPDEASALAAAGTRLEEMKKSRHLAGGPPPHRIEDVLFIIRPDGPVCSLPE